MADATTYDDAYDEGYDDYYENEDNQYNSGDEEEEQGSSPTGNRLNDIYSEAALTSTEFTRAVFGEDEKVFGLPYKYTALADPLMRVFETTFEANANVCFINVGTAKINKLLSMRLSAKSGTLEDAGLIFTAGNAIVSVATGFDSRVTKFQANFTEFYKYACVICNYVWTMMDLDGKFDWDDMLGSYDEHGLAFYCSKNSSATEGFSNSFSKSSIMEQTNSQAKEYRENYQLYGTYEGYDEDSSILSNAVTTFVGGIVDSLLEDSTIGGICSSFFNMSKGGMMSYPELWEDSSSSVSYSLQFKFTSAYGNKLDIFRNIYFPFFLLFTMASPRQNTPYAYKEPFLVRLNYPGWFYIECGYIATLEWNKGGDSQIWTVEGYPLEMVVNMSVQDLYPLKMITKSLYYLHYNKGLIAWMENMAGINLSDLSATSFSKKLSATISSLNTKVNYFTSFRFFKYHWSDFKTSVANKVSTF